LVPAITELQAVDASGRERVAASRSAPDRFDALTEVPETELWRGVSAEGLREGRTFFREGYLPTMRLAVFDGEGVVIATVDLRLLGEAIARVKAGPGGTAYVVDAQGLLIAHPQPTVLLSRLDLSRSPAVAAAFGAPASAPLPVRGLATEGLQREPVIVSAARVPGTSWLVFTEQLRGEALRPVWATLWRSLVLTLVGGLLALGLGIVFARRMAAPIVALRQATARIAGGDLESRLNVQPLDEIGDLAHDFDQMLLRLRELYASLEAKVASRTAELAERKEEAERANAAKTRFLAAASHDLRQPMHSISLLVGLLHQALREASQRQLAEKIQSSVATMESLFGNLLDISKLDAGTVRPHIEDVDLGWLLQRLEHTWAPQAEEKGLRLRVRPSAWTVRGDSALLERIVGNLVANAVRYTARGGVLVACRRRQGRCELQVWDTGPGIAPEHRQAIFEEFFRIDAPGTAQEKGLGLGLAIVQRCAGILGYDLAVDSRVGRGSVFRLSMPFVDGLGLLAMPAPPGLEPQGLAGQFIVVVDDDETNRSVLAQVLTA
jgi:signal transduction histidine kinase